MSSVSFLGALSGASSSSKTTAQRVASAGASFGLTLQGITDRANADAQAARALADSSQQSGDTSSVHDAPKPDDRSDVASKTDDATDTQSASQADKTDHADASVKTGAASRPGKSATADASKPAAQSAGSAQDTAAAAQAKAKARADAANAADDTDPTLADLTDAAAAMATSATDDTKSTDGTQKSGDAKSAQDALQAALAALNQQTPAALPANVATGAAREVGKGGDEQTGLLAKGGKGSALIGLTSAANASADAHAATAQTDVAALAGGQSAPAMPADAATAAYKQAADAAAHAVAMQSASASSTVSGPQGSVAASTSAAIAPHVGSSGWDDAFSQKVVFVSKSDQQSAELTLNPKDLGPLQVTLQVSENHAHALFVSQHAQVRDAVEAAMPKLREAMEANGISLGSASVSDGSAFARQSQQQGGDGRSGSGSGSGRGTGGVGGVDDIGTASVSVPVRRTVGLVDTFA
ncbi:flagellar hook-length control protein FliK [Caballeronia sp. LZ035]|uniref:flagellar hook-length control protein FliK n=1 Tax=Caballeronia sp. LZ035 TaxID=3038568 RepID=UPI002856C25B|nr:flagellar hook-length control protein FliK [Caballeronia sp. LZ035]MDR5755434.1 flagellar hook-length control protein FliK [Caballeronia sp. LZ035]